MYTSLERGVVDGLFVPAEFGIGRKFHEIEKYLTKADLGSTSTEIGMRLETWNKPGLHRCLVWTYIGRHVRESQSESDFSYSSQRNPVNP